MIKIVRGETKVYMLSTCIDDGGSGPPVVSDGYPRWHIISSESITVPTRRQYHIHGYLLNEGRLTLEGTAQLVIANG